MHNVPNDNIKEIKKIWNKWKILLNPGFRKREKESAETYNTTIARQNYNLFLSNSNFVKEFRKNERRREMHDLYWGYDSSDDDALISSSDEDENENENERSEDED